MRKTREEYIKGRSKEGLLIYKFLEDSGMSKKELADELGITVMALNYKLKKKFSKVERFYLKKLIEKK